MFFFGGGGGKLISLLRGKNHFKVASVELTLHEMEQFLHIRIDSRDEIAFRSSGNKNLRLLTTDFSSPEYKFSV